MEYLKPSIREIITRMRDARGRVLIAFLGLSVLGAAVSGIGFAYAEYKWHEALATIALTFTATALSAALIEVSVRIREIWERAALVRQFSAFFGYRHGGEGNVALVLACFETRGWTTDEVGLLNNQGVVGERRPTDPHVDWRKYSLKHLASMHSLGTTMADIALAADVISAISRVGLPAPTILWDIHAIEEASRLDGKFSTFISVGLCSNVFSVWAAKEQSKRLVSIDSGDTISIGSRLDSADASARFSDKQDQAARYGLITRFAIGEGKSAMIVGGISAEGSTMMSGFLPKHWRSLMMARDPNNHLQIGGRDFLAVLELRRSGVEVCDVRVRNA